ncbi:MAG: large-conductance mechanosensitive channel protein MscL [Rikenellaceae bacterium]|nr:large-conductance mechanosensitive channel protein MscL [Rikenellaceae bacterium]
MAKSKKFWEEFKEFAVKGNMIDLAVGVIVGGAFSNIVNSLVNDILMPPLGMLIGGVDFKDLKVVLSVPKELQIGTVSANPATINYGSFIQTVINFFIIAMSIFLFVRLINRLRRKQEDQPDQPAKKPDDVVLLEDIRDLLKTQNQEISGKTEKKSN